MGQPTQRGVSLPRELVDEIERLLKEYPELGYASIAEFIKGAIRGRLRLEKAFVSQGLKLAEIHPLEEISEEDRRRLSRLTKRAMLRRPHCPECHAPLTWGERDRTGDTLRCPDCGRRVSGAEVGEMYREVVDAADQLVLAFIRGKKKAEGGRLRDEKSGG